MKCCSSGLGVGFYVASLKAVIYPQRAHLLRFRSIVFASILVISANCCASAQDSLPNAPDPQPDVSIRNVPRFVLHDQEAIWTSPAHFKWKDLDWAVPLAAVTGIAIATDQSAMNHVVTRNADLNKKSTDASNVLLGGFIAAPVALYGVGHFTQSPHPREAGILSGEAMLDGIVVEQGMKLIFWRERPDQNNASGHFFKSDAGIGSSLPSSHSVEAWSAAAVLAGEYPSAWSRVIIYGAATGVSVARVMGQQHFPSDVIVGSATGWLVGHYVFRKHHKINISKEDY